jgi:DNA-directed RNA polymerase subunit alpha
MSKIVHPFEKPNFKVARQNESNTYGEFVLEPLERGFGLTLGNAFRRTLLSSLPGASVYAIAIDGVLHEFSTIPGVEEDVTMIILNLKDLILKIDDEGDTTKRLEVEVFGPCTLYARDLKTPGDVEIVNPDLEIAHLVEGAHLKMTVYARNGRGYVTCDENKELAKSATIYGLIATDSNYSPIVKVNYEVEPTRIGHDSRFDSLKLEVETDGSITPAGAVAMASNILISHLEKFLDLDEVMSRIASDIFKEQEIAREDKFVNMPIEDLDLSVRSSNCLKRQGFSTVLELTQVTEEDMMKFRNLGKKSYKEIADKLAELGLSFKKSN